MTARLHTRPLDTDLLIVGDGPAGLAAAIAVARRRPDLKVSLLGRRSPLPPIGESLPPGVRPYLGALGIWPEFLAQGHLLSYGTAACWGRPEALDNPFLLHPEGYGWQLQRERFDRLLADTARNLGVRLLDAVFLGCRADPGRPGWLVDGGGWRFRCSLLVDASGRNGTPARRLGAEPLRHDRLVGVYRFFAAADPDPSGPLVEAWEHGWWYSVGVPGGGLVCPEGGVDTVWELRVPTTERGPTAKISDVRIDPDGRLRTLAGQPVIDYAAVYPRSHPRAGSAVLNMLVESRAVIGEYELAHIDLTAIITGPGAGRFPYYLDSPSFRENPATPDRRQPYREFSIMYHIAPKTVQAFAPFTSGPLKNMISPGSSYTMEMTYNGSGNRNQTVGDSIFHCHIYPPLRPGHVGAVTCPRRVRGGHRTGCLEPPVARCPRVAGRRDRPRHRDTGPGSVADPRHGTDPGQDQVGGQRAAR